jgi:hypothetical protein
VKYEILERWTVEQERINRMHHRFFGCHFDLLQR